VHPLAATSSHEDVVVAVLGATAALAGLVLVFLGGLVTTYQSLVGTGVRVTTLHRFKQAGVIALGVFLVALATLALSVAWLAASAGATLYGFALGLFFVELAALAALAVYATVRVLLR
jgi:hypothetical protein